LAAKGCPFWNGNTDQAFMDKYGVTGRLVGDVGAMYSFQFRHAGAKYIDCRTPYEGQGIDQIQRLIDTIKNNPNDRRMLVSAWNVADLGKMCIAPCFVAGTKVLTDRGYVDIEAVPDQALLLTHLGNWKRINEKHVTTRSTSIIDIDVQYHPFDIHATAEHPFYARLREGSAQWINAGDLTPDHFVGMPVNLRSVLPATFSTSYTKRWRNRVISPPIVCTKTLTTLDEFWTLGYFLGRGWVLRKKATMQTRYRIFFAVSHRDELEIGPRLKSAIPSLTKQKNTGENVSKWCTRDMMWWHLLVNLGHTASDKIIPEWIQDAPLEFIQAFVDGYEKADGSVEVNGKTSASNRATIVSPHVALGLQRLYLKLGRWCGVLCQPPTCVMEGRTVNQSNTYSTCCSTTTELTGGNATRYPRFFDDGYAWFPVRKVHHNEAVVQTVYNFDVCDDHTYIVENVAVHNCHTIAQWFVQGGELSCQMYQRSNDWVVGVPSNVASYSLLTIMLAHVTGLRPGSFIHIGGDVHLYNNLVEAAQTQLSRTPPPFPTLRIKRQVPSIDAFEWSDFELSGYAPHPAIATIMAV
jgi:thymidylate synthase